VAQATLIRLHCGFKILQLSIRLVGCVFHLVVQCHSVPDSYWQGRQLVIS